MAPDDVAIIIAKLAKVEQELKDFKEYHDVRADERHGDTMRNIQLLEKSQVIIVDKISSMQERCLARSAVVALFEKHIEQEKRDKERFANEKRSFLLKVFAFPIGGFLTALGTWLWSTLRSHGHNIKP